MKERRKSRIVAWLLVFVILFLECGTGIVQAVEPNKEIQEDVRPEEDSEEADAYNKEDTVSGAVPPKPELLAKAAAEELEEKEGVEYVLGRPMTEEEEEAQWRLIKEYTSRAVSLEPDKAVQSLLDDSEDMVRAAALPSSYDARNNGYITSVKSQNPYGTCWAFSSINLAEASAVKRGLMGVSAADLSELHLAYYTYRFVTDPLGGTEGDRNYRNSLSAILDGGGNYNRTAFTLGNWIGAVNESEAPYGNARELPETIDGAYGKNAAKLRNVIEINKNDQSLVKQAIMDYGSVGIMYYSSVGSDSYNINTAAQYCNNPNLGVDHAVSVVGWDDNYSINNFITKPSANGAWLVKNSWGTGYGKSGYFWLSYEDATINTTVFAFDMMSSSVYDNNYQYDGAGGDSYIGMQNSMEVANVFTAHANQGKKELLKAVSFTIDATNVNYSIQIYKNPTNANIPTSGTPMLSTAKTGKTSYEGYYTVDLNQEVELSYGDKFAVVIAFSKPGEVVYVGVEANAESTTSSALAGQSFYKSGGGWQDWGSEKNSNIRIKAFTKNTNVVSQNIPVTGIDMPEKEGTLQAGESKSIIASVVPANATNKNLDWSSSDQLVATVDTNGRITAKKNGEATITAKTVDGGYTAQYHLTVREKSAYTNIYLSGPTVIYYIGTRYQFVATVYPSNVPDRSVTWSSSDSNVAEVDKNGLVTSTGIGTATITAVSNGDPTLKASMQVEVPDNSHNQVRSFVNRMYTVALNRKADNKGATYWTEELISGRKDGAAVAKGFVLSKEMENRRLSNSQYVDMLYRTFFDRDSDADGKAFWMNLLENGVSRAYVFRGFCHSQEFSNICSRYRIKRGTVTLTESRDKNHNITMYVFRCYDRTLGRKPDVKGLNFWTEQILNKKRTPVDVAGNFVFSTEFKNKKLSDEEYVKVLYRMFFDREYNAPGTDPNGIKFWLNELKSGRKDRYQVFMGFANSKEFKNVLKTFGL